MNGPDVLVPIAGMLMVVALALGIPLVRARIRERERGHAARIPDAQTAERLARIEAAVESIAVEVERISEGQRFTTKLLAERSPSRQEPTA